MPPLPSARPELNSPLLQYFTDLSSLDVNVRVSGVASLIRQLQHSQADFEKVHALSVPVSARPCCNDLNYTLARLVRGLSSSRHGARQGYSVALTETLQRFPNLRTPDVVAKIREATYVPATATRSEAKDLLMGRLFAFAALCRAGRTATPPTTTPTSAAATSAAAAATSATSAKPAAQPSPTSPGGANGSAATPTLVALLPELFKIADEKTWLAECAHEVVIGGVLALDPSVLAGAAPPTAFPIGSGSGSGGAGAPVPSEVLAVILPRLASTPPAQWCPNTLSLALALEAAWGSSTGAGSGPATYPAPLAALRAAFAALGASSGRLGNPGSSSIGDSDVHVFPITALRESTVGFPIIHTLGSRLFARYNGVLLGPSSTHSSTAAAATTTAGALGEFRGLWRWGVGEGLLAGGHARRATALTLLSQLLPAAATGPCPWDTLPILLSPHALRAISAGASKRTHPLAAASALALQAIIPAVELAGAGAGEGSSSSSSSSGGGGGGGGGGKRGRVASACLSALLSHAARSGGQGGSGMVSAVFGETVARLLALLSPSHLARHVVGLVEAFVTPGSMGGGEGGEGGAGEGDEGEGGGEEGEGEDEDEDEGEEGGGEGEGDQGERAFAAASLSGDGRGSSSSKKKRARSAAAGGSKMGGGEGEEDEEDEEGGGALSASGGDGPALSPLDMARLGVLESLVKVMLSRQVPSLRDPHFLTPIISLLAFHSMATLELPSDATTTTPTTTTGGGGVEASLERLSLALGLPKLLSAASGGGGGGGGGGGEVDEDGEGGEGDMGGKDDDSVAPGGATADAPSPLPPLSKLLIASPPLSPGARTTIQARLLAFIHALVGLQASAFVGEGEEGGGGGGGGGEGEDKEGGASTAGSMLTVIDKEQRATGSAHLGYRLASAIATAFNAAEAEEGELKAAAAAAAAEEAERKKAEGGAGGGKKGGKKGAAAAAAAPIAPPPPSPSPLA